MTEDPSFRSTRRALLAAGGSVLASGAVAGCSAIPDDLLGGGPTTIDASKLQSIVDGPVPSVPRPSPVPIEDAKLDAVREQTEERLSSVPFPLTAAEVPNGAVRREVTDVRDRARQLLANASDEPSAYAALGTLYDARAEAERVAVTWAAIDAGRTYDDVAKRAPKIRQDLDSFRDRWSYEGADPVAAVLVHRSIEARIAAARRRATLGEEGSRRRPIQPDHAINVGILAKTLERSRASLDGAQYIYGRFRETTSDRRPLRSRFESARESLRATYRSEYDALPDFDERNPTFVDRDVSGTPAERALEFLYYDFQEFDRGDERDGPSLAIDVLRLHADIAYLRAFVALRSRIEEGADVRIESADDVRQLRKSAIERIRTALQETAQPVLTRTVAADLVGWVEYADKELSMWDDTVRVDHIARDTSEYLMAGVVADVLPRTSADVARALTSA